MAWFSRAKMNDHNDEETEEASVGLIEPEKFTSPDNKRNESKSKQQSCQTGLVALLILSNIFWIVVNMRPWTYSYSVQNTHPTDFISTKALPSQLVTVEFDDLLMWNFTSKEVYRAMDASLPLYFGKPSPAIDAAWKALMRFEYPAINQEEMALNSALSFDPSDRHPVTGRHHIALDVFHNLHCLNAVRKELDKDYYGAHKHGHPGRSDHSTNEGSSSVDAAQRDHIDHCLNHIRQALQCRPDFSPAAMSVFTDTDGSRFFLGNAKRHSCYDWDSVMAWAEAREADLGFAPAV